jgi:hypothetical protein
MFRTLLAHPQEALLSGPRYIVCVCVCVMLVGCIRIEVELHSIPGASN